MSTIFTDNLNCIQCSFTVFRWHSGGSVVVWSSEVKCHRVECVCASIFTQRCHPVCSSHYQWGKLVYLLCVHVCMLAFLVGTCSGANWGRNALQFSMFCTVDENPGCPHLSSSLRYGTASCGCSRRHFSSTWEVHRYCSAGSLGKHDRFAQTIFFAYVCLYSRYDHRDVKRFIQYFIDNKSERSSRWQTK